MSTYSDCYRIFMEKWTHPDYRPSPIPDQDLDNLEVKLQSRLPLSYRAFLRQYGPAHTVLALLSNIVEQALEITDLSEFLKPDQVIELTNGWKPLGLPSDCIAIATNCCGSLFCFKSIDLESSPIEDAAVWFFDHDWGETNQVFGSFQEWICHFAKIEKVVA